MEEKENQGISGYSSKETNISPENESGYSGVSGYTPILVEIEEIGQSGVLLPQRAEATIPKYIVKEHTPYLLLKRVFSGLTQDDLKKARDSREIFKEAMKTLGHYPNKYEKFSLLMKEGLFKERGYLMRHIKTPRGDKFLGLSINDEWTLDFLEIKHRRNNPSWVDGEFSHRLFLYLMKKTQETLNSMVIMGEEMIPHWQKYSFGKIVIDRKEIIDYFIEKSEAIDPEKRASQNKQRRKDLREKIDNAIGFLAAFQFRTRDEFWIKEAGSFIIGLEEKEGDSKITLQLNPRFFDGTPLTGRVETNGRYKTLVDGGRLDYVVLPQIPAEWPAKMTQFYLWLVASRGKGRRGFGSKKRLISLQVRDAVFQLGTSEDLVKHWDRVAEELAGVLVFLQNKGAIKLISHKLLYDGKYRIEPKVKLGDSLSLILSLERRILGETTPPQTPSKP